MLKGGTLPLVQTVSPDDAARLVPDRAVVAISSSSGLNTPDRVLRAIGERFAREARPRDLTTVHPIGSGDMYGIAGIDHLAQPGLLKRVIAGSYPSGPSSLPMPAIWRLILEDAIQAYNLPSGLIFDALRNAAAGGAGVLTKVGLDTFVDPRREGGKMNRAARDDIVRVVEFDGDEWLHVRPIAPDVAIIRGTTADARGNVSMEHEAAPLGTLDLALAARGAGGLVIAQVKRQAASAIPTREVHVPGSLVDVVVVDPDQMQATETAYDPALSGETLVDLSTLEAAPFGIEKVIARRAALELQAGDVAALGFGVSALVPRILLEEGLHGQVTWTIEQGPVGGVPVTGFAFGCALNADAIIPSPQQFTFFQGAGFDSAFVSFLQIDAQGNVNVSKLTKRPYLTAGVGGFIDITARGRKLVFAGTFTTAGLDVGVEDGRLRVRAEGKIKKLVPEVEQVTFSGRRGREQGQDVTIVTERCVLRQTDAGLMVSEIAPGIDLERDVLAQAEIALAVSPELTLMDPRLFRPEPMGLELPTRRARGSER
jgi:acyl CoA:acetate/3-ketoacid CoA transferase